MYRPLLRYPHRVQVRVRLFLCQLVQRVNLHPYQRPVRVCLPALRQLLQFLLLQPLPPAPPPQLVFLLLRPQPLSVPPVHPRVLAPARLQRHRLPQSVPVVPLSLQVRRYQRLRLVRLLPLACLLAVPACLLLLLFLLRLVPAVRQLVRRAPALL